MRLLRALAWVFMAAMVSLPAVAGGVPLVLTAGQGVSAAVSLDGHMERLVDPGGSLQLQDVIERGDAFERLPHSAVQGFTSAAIWLRLTLAREPDAPQRWDLAVGPTFLDEVTLYAPDGAGGFTATRLGDQFPYAERPVHDVKFVFPLQVEPQPAVYYLRVRSTSAMLVQASVWRPEGRQHALAKVDVMLGLTLGTIGVMCLFNLVFWLWFREREHVYYGAYVLAMAMHLLFIGGHAARWLFPRQPELADHGVGMAVGLSCLTAIVFFCHVLDLRRLMPATYRLLQGMEWFFCAVMVMTLLGLYRLIAPLAVTGAFGVVMAGLLLPTILLWRGHRTNPLYQVAFVVFAVGNLPALLRIAGVPGMNVIAGPAMMLGTVLHLLLLNLALIQRVRQAELSFRRQKREALAAALQAERELESKVAQRTLSLQNEVERRSMLEHQLRAALETEKQALAEQRRFVAMVSHEFRTPLAIIHASTQSLQITTGTQQSRIRERVEKIGRAADRLSSMIDNYLAEDRLSVDGLQPQLQRVELGALIHDVASVALRDERYERLRIESDGQLLHVSCDPGLTTVAVCNVVRNALKYAPGDTPVIVRLAAHEGQALIDVEDQGEGVAPEDVPRMFAKYFRSESAGRVPGTGLGLYLARAIAAAQGGDVQLVRTGPRGSVFRLTLPLEGG